MRTTQASTNAFLVAAGLSEVRLQQIVRLALDPSAFDQDRVEFPEGGGDVDLELAVPFLPGMDEVTLDAARLTLHGVDAELGLRGWHTAPGPDARGTFVCLDRPARLVRVLIDDPAAVPGVFLVVRAATLDDNGVPSAGAPLAASATFDSGPMLPSPLAPLGVSGAGSGRVTLTVAAPAGQAWLVQYAKGGSLDELDAVDGSPQVFAVTVLSAPEDVSLVLQARDGAPDQALWQHPGAVLSEAADQRADFTPAAARRLNQALEALNIAGAAPPTLALPLRFHSASAGTLGVRDHDLAVRYLARPVGEDPVPVALDGGWQDIVLDAPTRPPSSSVLRLTARHLGVVVNAGSAVPPVALPSGGVRARAGRVVAGRVSWAGRDGQVTSLLRVRLLAVAAGDAEVVCEVRRDARGAPGELLSPPAVTTVSGTAPPGWVSFALTAPLPVTGSATLWVTVRTNRGELDWFVTGPAEGGVLLSMDGGSSWGETEGGVGISGTPVTQLLEQVEPALRVSPVVQTRVGDQPVGELALRAGSKPGEYVEATAATLPSGLLSVLGAAGPEPRRRTTLSVWSPDLLDVRLTDVSLAYDPFPDG